MQLRPIDLPLTISTTYTHYAQIGATSQLKLSVAFRQSEKLMKELDAARELDLTDQGGGKDKPAGETVEDAKKRAATEIQTAFKESLKFTGDPTVSIFDKIKETKKLIVAHT